MTILLKDKKELMALKEAIENLYDMLKNIKYDLYTHHCRVEKIKNNNQYYYQYYLDDCQEMDIHTLNVITTLMYIIQSLNKYYSSLNNHEKIFVYKVLNKIKKFKIECRKNKIKQYYFI